MRQYGDTTDANGNPQVTSGTLSLLSSIVQVGELVGSLSAAIVGGYLGRKGGLVAAVSGTASSPLQTTDPAPVYLGQLGDDRSISNRCKYSWFDGRKIGPWCWRRNDQVFTPIT